MVGFGDYGRGAEDRGVFTHRATSVVSLLGGISSLLMRLGSYLERAEYADCL